MKKTSSWSKFFRTIRARKFMILCIVAVCAVGSYGIYRSVKVANAEPQYVLSPVRTGSIIQTVTGTGQVSASNQTDIQAQVSGTITGIDVSVGQAVSTGELIATIDSKNAAITLQNAKIALAKLTQPAKATEISNAQNSIDQSYTTAYNATANIYLDMPAIVAGMKDLLYGQTGFMTDQRSSYLSSTARTYRDTAGVEYDAAVHLYQASMKEFNGTSRSSATSTLDQMMTDTYTAVKSMTKAVSDAQTALIFITTTQPDYSPKDAPTAQSNINTWASQINTDLSSLASAQNSIDTNINSYTTLLTGADQYDVQQQKLSLQQAQQTYDNYFVRAPYDGIVGRIPVNIYGQASGGTVIATIVGKQKIATISLDEVDAARVEPGQPVNITFDAIDNFTATGTVSQIDQVGTVTQGVVSYNVKISINSTDSRIKPGMSVNTTIITNEKDNVITVPSAAIKTQGGISYVQTFNSSVLGPVASSTRQFAGQFASTTNLASSSQRFASSTRQFGSSTGQGSVSAQTRSITISSATAPQQTKVTTGLSDDTNTEIVSGLNRGQLVVTRTIAASATQTTATAPSLLSGLGARAGGGGGGGAARGGTAAPAGR